MHFKPPLYIFIFYYILLFLTRNVREMFFDYHLRFVAKIPMSTQGCTEGDFISFTPASIVLVRPTYSYKIGLSELFKREAMRGLTCHIFTFLFLTLLCLLTY